MLKAEFKLKTQKRLLIVALLAVSLCLLAAPTAMAFCKGGCNAYVKISVACQNAYGICPVGEQQLDERAVNGKGFSCNFFGCDCDFCAPNMNKHELESWVGERYVPIALEHCKNKHKLNRLILTFKWTAYNGITGVGYITARDDANGGTED